MATSRFASEDPNSLLGRLVSRATAEDNHLSDAEMEWFQQAQASRRELETQREREREAVRQALIRRMVEAKAGQPQAAPQAAPAGGGDDFRPTIANARKQGHMTADMTSPQELVSAYVQAMLDAPPNPDAASNYSDDWKKWRAAKDAADRSTGERSLMGAAKQYYLSQTEPSKFGDFSEGDAVRLGLGGFAALPIAGAGVIPGAIAGAAMATPDAVLGTSDASDVALSSGIGAGLAAGIPALARGMKGMFYGTRSVPRVVADPMDLPARQAPLVRMREAAQLPDRSPPRLDRPPAGPYGGEDINGFLQRLNREMDEINNAPRVKQPFIDSRPMPTEQMALDMDMPQAAAPRASGTGTTVNGLKTELREAASATPKDINRLWRLRRLDDELSGWGDVSNVPRDTLMRSLQTSYKKAPPRKSGLQQLREQRQLALPERGRVAKEQPILIDPWGQTYFDVPTLYRAGGQVKG